MCKIYYYFYHGMEKNILLNSKFSNTLVTPESTMIFDHDLQKCLSNNNHIEQIWLQINA